MKKFTKNVYLISIVIIILVAAAVLILRTNIQKIAEINKLEDSLENLKASTKIQSYSSEKIPVLQSEDKIFGSPDAKVKIFVYEDYSNIYSANLADILSKANDEFNADSNNNLAFIFRPYLRSPESLSAAIAVDCAGAQGKWLEMRNLLFDHAKNGQSVIADLNSDSQKIGLDSDSFNSCLTNEQKSGKIEQLSSDPLEETIQGAPTMFIGSEMVLGARPYEEYVDSNGDKIEGLKQVIERQLKN